MSTFANVYFGVPTPILRVNRQIYREAWGIFQLENFWTIVSVNKAGFGKELKARGFPIATGSHLEPHIKFPVMRVTVIFSSLKDHKQNDVLVVATAHLKPSMRALWTATGASEMEVLVHIQPPVTNKTPGRRELLRPFRRLRSIKRVAVWNAVLDRHVDLRLPGMTTTDEIDAILGELTAGIDSLYQHMEHKQWLDALAQAEDNSVLMNDSQVVYDPRLSGVKLGVDPATARARSPAAKHVMTANALGVAELALHMHQFPSTIRFVNFALRIFPALPFPGDELAQSIVFLFRALALVGMHEPDQAFTDIEKARALAPDSSELAAVSRAWQDKFGPLPNSVGVGS